MVFKTSSSYVLSGAMFLFLVTFSSYAERAVKDENIMVLQSLVTELSLGRIQDPFAVAKTIYEESYKHKIDPLLVIAVVHIESSFRPHVISKKGAVGLMQIMPKTGREVASWLKWAKYSEHDLFDPIKNIRLGIYYLKKVKLKFKSKRMLYLTAYYLGPTRLMALQQEDPSTLRYLYAKRVLRVFNDLKARKIILADNKNGL